jgi:hypothetical protein
MFYCRQRPKGGPPSRPLPKPALHQSRFPHSRSNSVRMEGSGSWPTSLPLQYTWSRGAKGAAWARDADTMNVTASAVKSFVISTSINLHRPSECLACFSICDGAAWEAMLLWCRGVCDLSNLVYTNVLWYQKRNPAYRGDVHLERKSFDWLLPLLANFSSPQATQSR